MKRLLRRMTVFVASVVAISSVALAPAYAAPTAGGGAGGATNDAKAAICQGAAVTGANCSDGGSGLNGVITAVLNILSTVIGVAAVVMIILAGFKYITSGGDASGVKSAKDSLLYAIIGLVVVAMAQTIVRFVLHAA